MESRWYIIHVFTGYERRVSRYLQEEISRRGIGDLIDRIIVPKRMIKVRDSEGNISSKEKRLYPGYILIHAAPDDLVMQLISESPRVMGFLGKKAPQTISEEEAEKIMELMGTVEEISETRLLIDQSVRIIDGPFTDFNGTVKEVNREKERLTVMVTVFGRSTPVELGYNQVEST
ncbi:transcription termination/antitermination factor NusG [candidate division WOR-3 bacterium]|nr:transcription termination/antitermination factor NusG [candidate division WOR-3 bacterium]MCK4527915.1 transcription termination/antitermination factor NusG [candidate division WOR-3 bacterium]